MYKLELSGLGKSDGGVFSEVHLEGLHRCNGAVMCETFNAQGVVKAEELECQNQMDVEGVILVKNLKASNVEVTGVCRVKQQLQCGSLVLGGYLSVGESIKVQSANLRGKFKFNDHVEAESFELVFEGNSIFDVISGANVSLKRNEDGYHWENHPRLFRFKKIRMSGQLIEGERVEIEYCQVKHVYGDHVKIGPHCQIDEVEYKESLEIHPTAVVKVVKQI